VYTTGLESLTGDESAIRLLYRGLGDDVPQKLKQNVEVSHKF